MGKNHSFKTQGKKMKQLLIVISLLTSLTVYSKNDTGKQGIVSGLSNEFVMILLANEKTANGQLGKELLNQLKSIYSQRISNSSTTDQWKKCMNTELMFAELFNNTWMFESKTYEFLQNNKYYEEILLSADDDMNSKLEVQQWLIRESELFIKESENFKNRIKALVDKCLE
jgi:hypothetical protein